ncbi:hypothetical protein GCM10007079_19150 [Nocardiopsis terrae]|uniref:Uncharacterized protein n=1 Tax=Nocardiopsis terrae TaxID=372655 RepID=A0ABR9HHF4_9ACTN|nr:hypothetical protein [Nocardiopsis terrae]MBE1458465.1 hypothetical protein [Nocardiopsis terrae]GHC80299.1 hypothetical protein GCM10007079_19150 [Nocardiopsis terrae]
MAAPHPAPYGPPPHVDPRELRPSRTWYWVGGALIPLSLALGAVLFVTLILQATTPPDFTAQTRGTQSTTFTVDPAVHTQPQWLLYGSPTPVDHTACSLTGPDGQQPAFAYPTFNHEVEDPEGSWAMIGMTELTQAGEHTLTCQAPDDVRFALAYGADLADHTLTGLLSSLASQLTLPFLGAAGGLLLIIVTAVRRSSHRQHLIDQRTPHHPEQPRNPRHQNP